MKKILYIVSTLQSSGPTNQLYNLINNLNTDRFEPHVLTLSSEPKEGSSRWLDFQELGIKLDSLELSRAKGIILGKKAVKSFITSVKPDVVHTQGIRADTIMASLNLDTPWVMTARNFPLEDYPSKFGGVKGRLMAWKHLSAIRRCKHLVCCSKTILKKLRCVKADGIAIQNGVSLHNSTTEDQPSLLKDLQKPIFISVGSLIPRKNMGFLIEAFAKTDSSKSGSLVILGEGPQKGELLDKSSSNVRFFGNVNNVGDYLKNSDYFISTSLSEGLPNTVLEALSAGLPVILSDIESHQEISSECGSACKIVPLDCGSDALCKVIENTCEIFKEFSREAVLNTVSEKFSASRMSSKYQGFYNDVLEVK